MLRHQDSRRSLCHSRREGEARMTEFLYWSGVVVWAVAGSVSIFFGLDWLIYRVIESVWTKREFLAFVWSKLKKERNENV
jgi:hypothetical protein